LPEKFARRDRSVYAADAQVMKEASGEPKRLSQGIGLQANRDGHLQGNALENLMDVGLQGNGLAQT
jgi:hypothetical protein